MKEHSDAVKRILKSSCLLCKEPHYKLRSSSQIVNYCAKCAYTMNISLDKYLRTALTIMILEENFQHTFSEGTKGLRHHIREWLLNPENEKRAKNRMVLEEL